MSRSEKLLLKVLCGTKDKSILFDELCKKLSEFGFNERIIGMKKTAHIKVSL